jgi:hypothetical protein
LKFKKKRKNVFSLPICTSFFVFLAVISLKGQKLRHIHPSLFLGFSIVSQWEWVGLGAG